jgi:hypothetical protein
VAGTGDFTFPGGRGQGGQIASIATVFFMGGEGGNSVFGYGGRAIQCVSGAALAGVVGTGYGSGGAGAMVHNLAANAAGGDGIKGVVAITEFCSQ